MHLQEVFSGMQMSQMGVWYTVSQWSGTSSLSRAPPMPFNLIRNESAGIHQGHVDSEGERRKSFDIQSIQE